MPTKLKSRGLEGVTTVAIYIFLVVALSTYFLPVVRVDLPIFGTSAWTVQEIVRTLPKGFQPPPEQKELSFEYDFIDMVREVSMKRQAETDRLRISPMLVLGALVPVALALVYVLMFLGLFLTPLKRSPALVWNSLFAVVFACYVYAGVYVLNAAAQSAFRESLAKVEDSPFSAIAKNLIQKVTIQPDAGLMTLVLLTLVVFGTSLYRRSRSLGY